MTKECDLCRGTAKLRWKQLGYICWNCEKDFQYKFERWMKHHEAREILHQIQAHLRDTKVSFG